MATCKCGMAVWATVMVTRHLLWFIVILQACEQVEPQDVIGRWSIDQLMEDGLDRTSRLGNMPWGTAIEFSANGKFLTNGRENNQGTWRVSEDGATIYLYFRESGVQYKKWKVAASKKYLALKATTKQLYLSRRKDFPRLPPAVINLKNHLPGTWYFYQIKVDGSPMSYRQNKRALRWMKISKYGAYRSGVGNTINFRGHWVLKADTLTFSDRGNNQQTWKIKLDKKGVLYFYALPDDTARWEVISFRKHEHLPL